MNEVDIIRGAREILSDPNKWGKGQLRPTETSYCAVGALCESAGYFGSGQAELVPTFRLITAHLPDPDWCIGSYNDHPSTTHADILALLDKTLADLGGLG